MLGVSPRILNSKWVFCIIKVFLSVNAIDKTLHGFLAHSFGSLDLVEDFAGKFKYREQFHEWITTVIQAQWDYLGLWMLFFTLAHYL